MKDIYEDIEDSKIYTIVGYVNETPVKNNKKNKYLGGIEELKRFLKNHECDEILYIDSDF